MTQMQMYCCGCGRDIQARLTNGQEVYPHREDLYALPFWMCDGCHNYVGCHHKTDKPTKPLGCIPTPAIRRARRELHQAIDPLWRSGIMSRGEVYRRVSAAAGRTFHVAQTRSVGEVLEFKQAAERVRLWCR